MKKVFMQAWCFVFLLVFACSSLEKKAIPPLSMEKTALILSDQIIADAAVSSAPLSIKDSLTKEYYKQIFLLHDTSLELYDSSLAVFAEDPKEIEQLYNLVDSIFGKNDSLPTPN